MATTQTAAVEAATPDRSALWVGIVGALAALLGAGVGGYVTYRVSQDQINASANDAAAERLAAAIGTARLMQTEFEGWAVIMRERSGAGRYARATIRVATELDAPTRLVVASAVGPDVWRKVALAENLAPKAERLTAREPNKQVLIPDDRTRALIYAASFEDASRALGSLAGKAP